ncbi:MAG: CCA tRNA nucleotidyltransferase [Hyphomicrobium sp.]
MTKVRDDGASSGKPLAGASWLEGVALGKVFAALCAEGGTARVVGGAVRNALIGLPITDIDLATPLRPEEVTRRAVRAGLAVHPTGIAHGTVTLVAGGHPFEVTTLRRDVETDGRRAVIAFSEDWREDAARRDFTFNALYAAADGTVFDFFGGLQDLEQRRVRFIGSAQERIREDYLRILRFFRFNAQYGTGPLDAEGLAACAALKEGLAQLSSERVGAETMKLLAAPQAAPIVAVMANSGILEAILGAQIYPTRLERLAAIEAANGATLKGLTGDPICRLAALALDGPENAAGLAKRLRLSNAAGEALAGAATGNDAYDPATPERQARALLYRIGLENFRSACIVAWAASNASPNDGARLGRLQLPERWAPPALPVSGAGLIALGMPPGPRLGKVLADFEKWWIGEDFPSDPALHKAKLTELCGSGY